MKLEKLTTTLGLTLILATSTLANSATVLGPNKAVIKTSPIYGDTGTFIVHSKLTKPVYVNQTNFDFIDSIDSPVGTCPDLGKRYPAPISNSYLCEYPKSDSLWNKQLSANFFNIPAISLS